MKNMTITTPMTAAMEMHNWLSDKLQPECKQVIYDMSKKTGSSSNSELGDLSSLLEKYFSTMDVQKQKDAITATLNEVCEVVSTLEKKPAEEPRLIKMKEERKREISTLYEQ